jgi:hypothetical protein
MKLTGITGTALMSLLLGIAASAYAQHEQPSERQDHPKEQSKHEPAKPGQQHAQKQQKSEQKQQQPRHEQTKAEPQHAQKQQQPDHKQQQPQHAQKQQRPSQNGQHERAQSQPRQEPNKHSQHTEHAQQQDRNKGQEHAQQRDRPQHSQEQQRVQHTAWQEHRSQHWDSDHRTWQQRGGYNGYRIPDDRFRGYFGRDHRFRINGLPFLVVGGYPRFQYSGYWFSLVDPWPEYWGNDWYDTDDVYVTYVDNGYYLFNRRYPNAGIAISISM